MKKSYNYHEEEAKKAIRMQNYPRKSTSIRFKDDLEYTYTKEQCEKEIASVRGKSGDLNSIAHFTKTVLTYQPHFYEIEKRLWREDKNGIRDFLLSNRLKYIYKDEYQINDKEVLRGFKISAKHIGFTHFSPLWVKAFIEKFNVSSIYDPCAGWGHRLIGSYDIKYIGNDFDSRTVDGLNRIISDFNMSDKVIYNNDCRYFTPDGDYEAVFTCPPYFNVETYSNKSFKDVEDFDNFLHLMVESALKPSVRLFGVVINNTYVDNVKRAFENNGLKFNDEIVLGNKLSHYQRNGARAKKCEIMLIYET